MKDLIIAANWKMNKTVTESISFVTELDIRLKQWELNPKLDKIEVLIFPPFLSIYPVKGKSELISIGSQNIYFEESGAFTGEISTEMVREYTEYALIGHSERREIFGETDSDINKKIRAALSSNLTPLLCVGETLEEREAGNTFKKIEDQLKEDLNGFSEDEIEKIVFAYEPVWAIGTGRTASPEQAQEVHSFITEEINKISGKEKKRMILYGGSVKPENCKELLAKKDINGALIGGASLKVESFFAIIEKSLELV
ncbi:MAG: triose-phosphate isomerase [Acidobacteriota bacterium]